MVFDGEITANTHATDIKKLLLAHAISERPGLQSVESTVKASNLEAYKAARARGLSKEDAIKVTPLYRSAEELGFSRISPNSNIPDNVTGEFNLILLRDTH